MKDNIIDATERFEARQPWNIKLRERVLNAQYHTMIYVGRLGTSERTESAAYRYGVRRSAVLLSLATLALGVDYIANSEQEEHNRTAELQACVDQHSPEGTNLVVKNIGDGLAYGDTSGPQYQRDYVIGEAPDATNESWQIALANGKILKLCLDPNKN